ncbi:hypothetical protein [Capnocytophaga catalasegens]|uniref:Lipoprotein n=1 Tax=Capnocytophaga catalasegens TaxID=1004260 RepID=A0AAV5AYE4_9FLAO|nr:hypothetical protein [Capnocytophaga catalasegens]GIZ16381.1 hypothetical protein RCZ03_23810 [Capnocytophaga catalasegens]GJM51465.1 hypothetical protein RCZ15_24380 [Capnocytophaga catalasegens]GJM53720.1 hypothetical protein RCZ16_20360 [Capnocytophaga catalasegens]
MIKFVLMIFLVFGITSCSDFNPNKPTTFCQIEDIVYVVNNVPNDTLLLKKEIEKLIFQSQYLDSLKKKEEKEKVFLFYKGDKYLTCNFKEGEPYKIVPKHMTLDTIQDLRNHTEIARIHFTQSVSKVWYYNYWLRSSKEYDLVENSKRLKFKDIDSLFRAKQKEYGIK